MVIQELQELEKVLQEEKQALMKGAVEEILKWASYKARLVDILKEKNFSEEDKKYLEKLIEMNERNKKIIEAGLSFIEEAYKFLNQFLSKNEPIYGRFWRKKPAEGPKFLSKSV